MPVDSTPTQSLTKDKTSWKSCSGVCIFYFGCHSLCSLFFFNHFHCCFLEACLITWSLNELWECIPLPLLKPHSHEQNPRQSLCLCYRPRLLWPEQCRVEFKVLTGKSLWNWKCFCFSPVCSLIHTWQFITWIKDMNLQRHFTTAVEFCCACVQPPELFDAFMFHPSGMDTQPGADGLTNLQMTQHCQ